MWNEAESEAVRVQKIFRHNGTTGDALVQKFKTASREDVRLAAALRGYFLPDATDAEKALYYPYLVRRIRPAVTVLMEENRVADMEILEKQNLFTPEMVDAFLQTAIEMRRSECIVWLLQRKDDRYGYRDHDFRL